MANQSLPQWLTNTARRMKAHFDDSAELEHPGAKGTDREKILFREFLDRYPHGMSTACTLAMFVPPTARCPRNWT